MELVSLSPSKRRERSSPSLHLREPLIHQTENFPNEYLSPLRSQYRRRRYRSQVNQPVLAALSYQAPRLTSTRHHHEVQPPLGEGTVPFLGQPADQHNSLVHHIHHNLLHQHNPAQDLSVKCLSHGAFCFQCVRTQEVGLSENFGRFEAVIAPGLHLQCWPCATIAARLSLRIQQFNVLVETKTEDHVFCHVQITVQYRIIPEMAYFAYYRLQQPQLQLQSHILDVVRAAVPLMTVDQLYQSKQRVANAVHERLASVLCEYGYDIVTALVTHITPTPTVQWAMNEVEACRREKLAKPQIAEARQIQIIKQAEAQAEADYLQGVGVAKQRREIYAGLRENARELENDFEHVMDILLLTQYFDLLAHMGANEMFVRAVPGEVMNIQQGLKGREHVNCYDDDSSSGIDGACNEEEDVEEEKSAGVDNEKFAMHLLEGEIA